MGTSPGRRIGQPFGRETAILTVEELPTHKHPFVDHVYWDPPERGQPGYHKDHATLRGDDHGGIKGFNRETTVAGEGKPFAISPPSLVVNFIIRASS